MDAENTMIDIEKLSPNNIGLYNNASVSIPFIAFEAALDREERKAKRLIITLIIAIVMMFASNAIWLYAWCQYDYGIVETDSVKVETGDGNANYVGNDGDINNGTN